MGGEAQEGRGVYILTDSQCLTAAASNYLPIKNEKKKTDGDQKTLVSLC